jgi:hypothetical protein
LRKAAVTERDEDVSPGNTDESMCSSVAMGFLPRGDQRSTIVKHVMVSNETVASVTDGLLWRGGR